MGDRTCSIEECIRPVRARGWCANHYMQRRRQDGLLFNTTDPNPCSMPDCGLPSRSRGWCNVHYRRWLTHGDPNGRERTRTDPVIRFWSKVNRTSDAACWPWTGAKNANGYGTFWTAERFVRVHRYAYEITRGPIPEGLVLDHLCRNRACVNPSHLEPVTQRENTIRGVRWETMLDDSHQVTRP